MKRLMLAVALCIPVCAVAQTATPAATIATFGEAFNKGDMKTVIALHATDNVTILDELAPHIWQGPKAVEAWLASLDADGKAMGKTDNAVTIGKPQVLTVTGDRAYAVVPAVYTWKQKGVPMRETSTITFAMHKAGAVWKIQGWSWNGTVPRRVK